MRFTRREPDFTPVPAEPAGHQLDARTEARIVSLDERIFIAHRKGDGELADALLDNRNHIRPPLPAEVPVIPGRQA